MNPTAPAAREARPDQADGLRRLFSSSRVRFVPVVSNPHVRSSGAVLEQLCAAYAEAGLHTLFVDAAEGARAPSELAYVDLGACIEPLSGSVSYLAARGLPMRYTNARGSAAQFIQALVQSAPQAEVVLLHASAPELARVVALHETQPLLLADIENDSVTHAYAGMKWLSQRTGLMVYSLLLAAHPQLRLAARIAQQLTTCADSFLGAVVRDWACVDPRSPVGAPLTPELRKVARELLGVTPPGAALAASQDSAPLRPIRRGSTAAHPPGYQLLAGAL